MDDRILYSFLGDLTCFKPAIGEVDAAHVQAFHHDRVIGLSYDKLGAAPPDIDHQPVILGLCQAMGNPLIHQTRLFLTCHDIDGKAQCLLGSGQKGVGVASPAQGVGADRHHVFWGQILDALPEATQAIQRFGNLLFGQYPIFIQPCGQSNHLLDCVDGMRLIIL